MPGDPEEYRQHALRCADLAHTARTIELKQTLMNLSRHWVKLAAELEHARALRDKHPPESRKSA
jgi:hypothetical protein